MSEAIYKDEEYIEAIRRSGVTPQALEMVLGQFMVLMEMEQFNAKIINMEAERQLIVDEWSKTFSEKVGPLDTDLQSLKTQLETMRKQAAVIIAPGSAPKKL
jgi:hypothetical protein